MGKVGIKVNCILNLDNGYARMLVMQTLDNQISFPIIIADNEAVSLLKELENIKIKRPLTHDLFFATLQSFQIQIREVYIYDLKEGIFFTKMLCEKDNEYVEIDARPSDAIILAIKNKAPILVEEFILERLGKKVEIIFDTSPQKKHQKTEKPLAAQSIEELEKKLNQAIEIEDFEAASEIRDLINERKLTN